MRLIEADNPKWDDLYVAMMTPAKPTDPVFIGPGQPLSGFRDDNGA